MKFLIVEDNYASRKLLKHYVDEYADADFALNGEEAAECCSRAVAAGEQYAVVLLDIVMPGMDGHETLKRIREIEDKAGLAPERRAKVVMVSSHDDRESLVSSFDEGCDGYVVKPVDDGKLANVLGRLGVSASPSGRAEPSGPPKRRKRGKKKGGPEAAFPVFPSVGLVVVALAGVVVLDGDDAGGAALGGFFDFGGVGVEVRAVLHDHLLGNFEHVGANRLAGAAHRAFVFAFVQPDLGNGHFSLLWKDVGPNIENCGRLRRGPRRRGAIIFDIDSGRRPFGEELQNHPEANGKVPTRPDAFGLRRAVGGP